MTMSINYCQKSDEITNNMNSNYYQKRKGPGHQIKKLPCSLSIKYCR